MLWSIIVGGIIGWLAGKLMGSRGGVLRNIILGLSLIHISEPTRPY